MQNGIVDLEKINYYQEQYHILKSISLSFPENMTSVIMGPVGCGKSTLLKIAAGITPPDSGTIRIYGNDIDRLTEKELIRLRKTNGFVFQDAALWANKTVYQNLSLPLEFHFREFSKEEIRRRIDDIIRRIGYQDSHSLRPAQLSSGEKKLVSIGRALITGPSLLFMDDPTTMLDRTGREKVTRIIMELKEKRYSIIVTTHDPYLTSMIADYLFILKDGVLIEAGAVEEVVSSSNRDVISILTDVLSSTATYDTDILDLLETPSGETEEKGK